MAHPSAAADRSHGRGRRVMYVQYTNPAAYPPIEHSAWMLAAAGCDVRLVGTRPTGERMSFQQGDRVRVTLMPFEPGGWRQKVHYARFASLVAREARRWRPDWIYVSDPLACPAALALGPLVGAKVVYHEHDSPSADVAPRSTFMKAVLRARRAIAARAELCVLPNEARAEMFKKDTGRRANVLTVWNCPRLREVAPRRDRPAASGLRVLYHGSIVPARLPATVIDALAQLPESASLVVAGYETAGHPGYLDSLRRHAARLGVSDRVTFAGTLPTRDALMAQCETCDVGLALLPKHSTDLNERSMVGASNKSFEYLACGLALLVGDMPEWRATFVDGGFARSCDPDSADSIAQALRWFLEHPDERLDMGERGRQRVGVDWNYDHQFAPVLAVMT